MSQVIDDLESQIKMSGVFQRLLTSGDGQSAIDHLKLRFFHDRTTLAVNPGDGHVDPNRTLFNEGSRFVVEYMLGLINQDIAAIEAEIQKLKAPPESDDLAT